MAFAVRSWETSHVADGSDQPEKTGLQRAVERALADLPEARDHYDRIIQARTGKTGKVLYDIQRGKSRNPGMETLRLIAEVLGKPLTFFTDPTPAPEPDLPPVHSASEGETTPIIALDLSLSMGPGTPIEDFIESEPVEFDIGWLRRITSSPYHRLRLLRGIGDSMEPKFYTGDRILLDTTERKLARLDGYYWITLWGAHGLKRLRPAGPTRVTVISENSEHDPIEVDASELTIEGRAIWFGRDL